MGMMMRGVLIFLRCFARSSLWLSHFTALHSSADGDTRKTLRQKPRCDFVFANFLSSLALCQLVVRKGSHERHRSCRRAHSLDHRILGI
jgi:hypothetical protein